MTSAPGKVGKSYPVGEGQNSTHNSGPTAQANVTGDRFGWIVALLFAVLALVLAIAMYVTVRSMSNDLENVRGLIENSAAAASSSASAAAVSADRSDRAERRANIAEAQAKQVFVELNRLGYPVQTTIEPHSVAPAEAFNDSRN